MEERKYCAGCDRELAVSAFGRNEGRPDGLQTYCRECMALRLREFRRAHGLVKPEGWVRKTADMVAYRKARRLKLSEGGGK